jgi:hypothetical protein
MKSGFGFLDAALTNDVVCTHLEAGTPSMPGGAGDGTRTRDNLLGRQGLCQLSYSRETVFILAPNFLPVKRGACFEEMQLSVYHTRAVQAGAP